MELLKKQKTMSENCSPEEKAKELKEMFKSRSKRMYVSAIESSRCCDFKIYGSNTLKEKEYWREVKKYI